MTDIDKGVTAQEIRDKYAPMLKKLDEAANGTLEVDPRAVPQGIEGIKSPVVRLDQTNPFNRKRIPVSSEDRQALEDANRGSNDNRKQVAKLPSQKSIFGR